MKVALKAGGYIDFAFPQEILKHIIFKRIRAYNKLPEAYTIFMATQKRNVQ